MWQELLRKVRGGGGGGGSGALTPFVGAYGKLPGIGDFVAVRAQAEPALAFQGWLARAVEWADRRQLPGWPTVFDNRPPMVFTFRPRPKNGGVLVGLMKASRDTVGRRYPFAIFAAIPEQVARAAPHLLPIAMAPFIEQAAHVFQVVASATSTADVEAALAPVRPPPLDDAMAHAYDGWIRGALAADFWRSLYGASGPGPAYAIQMIHEVLAPFQQVEEPRTDIAVRLPLKSHPAYEAAFWLDLIQRVGHTPRPVPTSLFYPAAVPGRALFVTLGDSHPNALAEAAVGTGDTDLVCDLTTPEPERSSMSRLPTLQTRIEGEMRREDATLADILRALEA